ncbi:MAG: branched-chain amino acid ABC transporter permease [Halofilum sp. (in: g-proteobacteria)]|nr:branched-chain amino acid ABC transporter permease [Halofilum sp. (in: g-proteobacteria)]
MELSGYISYLVFFLSMVGIYAVLALGLNMQWGFTGQLNIGVAAFFAVGAYSSAILTTAASGDHLGGFGMPFVVGLVVAMAVAGVLALAVGLITLNLRSDYLAIATIGIAEIVRLVLKNEQWLTNGVRGMPSIPNPVGWLSGGGRALAFLGVVALIVAAVYWTVERLYRSPWARVLRAIRANEDGVRAAGKNVLRYRVEAFVIGSMFMGLGGALYAHFTGFISPAAFDPMFATFVVWVMLIAGGSGNNRGALLGALVIWGVWTLTESFTGLLPGDLATRASALRIFLIGLLLEIILLTRPQGLLPERPPKPIDSN